MNSEQPHQTGASSTGRMNPLWMLIIALLVIDVAFIAIHLSHLYGPGPSHWRWDLGVDLGFAEFFQYAKELAVAVVCFILFMRHRQLILLGLSGIFAFLALDDALQGHEKVGGRIARGFDIPAWESSLFGSVRGQDFGELIAAAIFVLPMIVALAWGWMRADTSSRQFSIRLIILGIALGMFGVVLDFVVNAVDTEWIFLLEDGTEMFIMSAAAWFVALVMVNDDIRTGMPVPVPVMGPLEPR